MKKLPSVLYVTMEGDGEGAYLAANETLFDAASPDGLWKPVGVYTLKYKKLIRLAVSEK